MHRQPRWVPRKLLGKRPPISRANFATAKADGGLRFLPWHGPHSEVLAVEARARDPLGLGWIFRAKKLDSVDDETLNCFSEGENQVDHVIALKSYGASSSLARWAALLGMRWLGQEGGRSWKGVMLYPDVDGLNARMRALNRDAGHFVFVANTSGVDIPHMEYGKMIARGMVPLGSQGSTHFHDLLTHALGYAMYPPDVVQNITRQLRFLLRVEAYAAANLMRSHGRTAHEWAIMRDVAERSLTRTIKILDRHSTFLPMMILPDDSTPAKRAALWMMDTLEAGLLRMTRGHQALSYTKALERLFHVVEACCVSRHAHMDVIFAVLEDGQTFDRRVYFEFSKTLMRSVTSLRAELLGDLKRLSTFVHVDVERAIDDVLQEIRWTDSATAVMPASEWTETQAWRRALELCPRLRREIKAIVKARTAHAPHVALGERRCHDSRRTFDDRLPV